MCLSSLSNEARVVVSLGGDERTPRRRETGLRALCRVGRLTVVVRFSAGVADFPANAESDTLENSTLDSAIERTPTVTSIGATAAPIK